MASKRKIIIEETEKSSKQTKLNFGQKMPTKSNPATSKAGSTKPSASSSKNDAITSKPPPKASHGLEMKEVTGDIFDAPDGTVIIHACNCVGSWGAGIAAAFKKNYPNAFKDYQAHCKKSDPEELIKTALLIPPKDGAPKHWVGCLFTSKVYGKKKDTPQQILDATTPAMADLIKQMSHHAEMIKEIRICQINSGLFAVPWEHSKAVIEGIEVGEDLEIPSEIIVYSLPEK